jgi:hypothetical protein
VFCIISPLVLLPCAAYFLLGLTVERYQVVYVAVPGRQQAGGQMWRQVSGPALVEEQAVSAGGVGSAFLVGRQVKACLDWQSMPVCLCGAPTM